jgi:GNAT superfamily N-acetyltransferase
VAAWADYLAVQRRRAATFAAPVGGDVLDEVGISGWATSPPHPPSGRLFVHDGAAADRLTELLDRWAPLEASVLGEAPGLSGCVSVLDGRTELGAAETATAMFLPAPAGIPLPPLDPALSVEPVGTAVSVEAAAAAGRLADPGLAAAFGEQSLVAHLRRIPGAVLLAAVDEDGAVVATAGASVLGTDATVFFVSTDPAWRGRGVATAMTARALHAAAARGATLASLDASAAGRGSYARLGFQEVGVVRSWKRHSVEFEPRRGGS